MIKIYVQNAVHGGEPCLVTLPLQASLKMLKAHLIAHLRDQGRDVGHVSLIYREDCLRDEFNMNESRWMSLAEYGIQDGTLLGMVQQASLCGPINLVLRLLDADGELIDGEYLPIEIDAGATLADLKVLVCEIEGLALDNWKLSVSLGTGKNLAWLNETSLAQHGLEEGTTLGLRLCYRRRVLSDLTNVECYSAQQPCEYRKFRSRKCRKAPPALRHSLDFEQSPSSTPQHALSSPFTGMDLDNSPCHRTQNTQGLDGVQTPKKLRLAAEQVQTPCKTKRPKQSKVSSSLKRL